tara:strand:- start:975 stop:2489 length:1515 start_codon:yes stop_codon:yes gene_type:complete
MSFGGGGSSQPADQKVTQTNLPEYVRPYFERLLQRGEANTLQDYTPYGGQRLAYFSPDELTSQAMTRGYATSGTPQAYTDAATRYGTQTPYTSGYTAGTSPTAYQAGTVGADSSYQAGTLNQGYNAGTFDSGYQARDIASGYDPTTRQSGYVAGQTAPTYQPIGYEENLSRFMSPYQQNVIDVEKREAARQSDIMGKGIGDQATAQGGLGGYREGIQQAERERNLGQQLGDIQTRGSQAAFESAQQQLDRERAGGLGAAKFGLDAFTQQQAAQQQQETLAQRSFETAEQARQQKETFAQSAYNAGENARQRAAELGLNAQQQEDAAKQAQEKFSQSGFQQQQQALQQQAAQSLRAYQAQQQALQQQGAQDIQAYQAQQQAQQAQERFGQSAYDISNRYNLASAQGLQNIGGAQQKDALSRIQALSGIGAQDRALQQASMDIGYQDFLRQQNYAKQQLGDYSNLLQGVPATPGVTESTYEQQPGLFQQAAGAGLAGLGLYRGMGG